MAGRARAFFVLICKSPGAVNSGDMVSPMPHKPTTNPAPHGPYVDPVIEAYKKDVDRTLIRAMLMLTPEQRLLNLERVVEDIVEMRRAAAAAGTRARR